MGDWADWLVFNASTLNEVGSVSHSSFNGYEIFGHYSKVDYSYYFQIWSKTKHQKEVLKATLICSNYYTSVHYGIITKECGLIIRMGPQVYSTFRRSNEQKFYIKIENTDLSDYKLPFYQCFPGVNYVKSMANMFSFATLIYFKYPHILKQQIFRNFLCSLTEGKIINLFKSAKHVETIENYLLAFECLIYRENSQLTNSEPQLIVYPTEFENITTNGLPMRIINLSYAQNSIDKIIDIDPDSNGMEIWVIRDNLKFYEFKQYVKGSKFTDLSPKAIIVIDKNISLDESQEVSMFCKLEVNKVAKIEILDDDIKMENEVKGNFVDMVQKNILYEISLDAPTPIFPTAVRLPGEKRSYIAIPKECMLCLEESTSKICKVKAIKEIISEKYVFQPGGICVSNQLNFGFKLHFTRCAGHVVRSKKFIELTSSKENTQYINYGGDLICNVEFEDY